MTTRVGAKGQVVIPKPLRDRLNLRPGDEVDFEVKNEEIVLKSVDVGSSLGGRFEQSGMAARLLEDRRHEPA
jgi:AbrB family looped-hinge helix DNA binding protein